MSWDAGIFFSRGPRVRFGTKYLVSKGCYLAASKWQERIVDLHLEALLVELADFYSDCWANLERAYSFESVIISSKIHGRMCWSLDNYLFMYMFLSPKTARFRWTVFLRLISILTKLEGLRSLLIIRSWLFSPDVSSSRDSVFPQIAIAIKKPCASEKAWEHAKVMVVQHSFGKWPPQKINIHQTVTKNSTFDIPWVYRAMFKPIAVSNSKLRKASNILLGIFDPNIFQTWGSCSQRPWETDCSRFLHVPIGHLLQVEKKTCNYWLHTKDPGLGFHLSRAAVGSFSPLKWCGCPLTWVQPQKIV